MYVLRRTVGTGISIGANDEWRLTLSGIDWDGGCALVGIKHAGQQKDHELGSGEHMQLTEDIGFRVLTIALASHEGTPSRVVEFGFDAPREIPIVLAEKLLLDSPT